MGERPSVWGSQFFSVTVLITVILFLSILYIQGPLKLAYEKTILLLKMLENSLLGFGAYGSVYIHYIYTIYIYIYTHNIHIHTHI